MKKVTETLTLRGKTFSQEDLLTIQNIICEHFDKGRTYISKTVCERLNWKQPNGWLKDRACREVLVQLEQRGIITLPQSRKKLTTKKIRDVNNEPKKKEFETSLVTHFPEQIEFELAKGNKAEKLWNELIRRHHYLGHKVVVGRCLKYLVKADEIILGALAFSSPAWQLESRDDFLKELEIKSENKRDLVINNSRFLMLPNIQVPNLASTILSIATRKIVIDWEKYYLIKPLIAETFVQPSMFRGTCYKASNWIEIGLTKGYAKNGASYHNSQEPKQIYLYGLNKKIRRKMLDIVKNKEYK